MRYHIWTEGCQMNEADSEKLAAGLAKLGWEEAAKANEADLAVVNTCVVRQKAEDRAAGYLGLLRKLKESRGGGLQIAVEGVRDRASNRRDEDRGERGPRGQPLVEGEHDDEGRHDHDPAADAEERSEETCEEADGSELRELHGLVLYESWTRSP